MQRLPGSPPAFLEKRSRARCLCVRLWSFSPGSPLSPRQASRRRREKRALPAAGVGAIPPLAVMSFWALVSSALCTPSAGSQERPKTMVWWLWVLLGLGLLTFEVLTPGGFFAVFFGLAALLVEALTGLDASGPPWLQWLLFSGIS